MSPAGSYGGARPAAAREGRLGLGRVARLALYVARVPVASLRVLRTRIPCARLVPQLTRVDPDALPPPTEADKLTRVLFGEYYSHAASILDLTGKNVVYFVFSDLSVKLEGLFRPHYRFFDLFSRAAGVDDVPHKGVPGLKASMELTKHLSRWGIRVNICKTERKRRGGGGGLSSGGVARQAGVARR
ncbi:hypothetical protein DFH11DRAFT_1545913 [Phellopilus nigrolimitatus]|nr:hypothetical protein DFH11DRAFT_1545913 [Phellopilus nigrolimitatus]